MAIRGHMARVQPLPRPPSKIRSGLGHPDGVSRHLRGKEPTSAATTGSFPHHRNRIKRQPLGPQVGESRLDIQSGVRVEIV